MEWLICMDDRTEPPARTCCMHQIDPNSELQYNLLSIGSQIKANIRQRYSCTVCSTLQCTSAHYLIAVQANTRPNIEVKQPLDTRKSSQ